MVEELLAGGNASGAVVRVGDTVRKTWTDAAASVGSFMNALRDQGVAVPAHLGRDEQGRQVLEFVPGELALGVRLTRAELHRVGALIRRIHDASAMYEPAPDATWRTAIPAAGADLISHNDLAPWNLIIGERWVFIDWDAAAPTIRLWDLAYAAQAFTLSDVTREAAESAIDLAALVTGYGADRQMRHELPAAIEARTGAMLALLRGARSTGEEPWASMESDGHGAHWEGALEYVRGHREAWKRALTV